MGVNMASTDFVFSGDLFLCCLFPQNVLMGSEIELCQFLRIFLLIFYLIDSVHVLEWNVAMLPTPFGFDFSRTCSETDPEYAQ